MAMTKAKKGLSVSWAEKGDYEVRIVDDVFDADNPALADLLKGITGSDEPHVMLVADSNVVHRTEGLGTKIGRYVQTHGITLIGSPVVLGGGEKAKSDDMDGVKKIAAAAVNAKVGANDVMLVIGGGTVLDVAGYIACQVRGGIKLVRMPTTPAAMVDAAFADCAAINLNGIKDALRVPCRPSAVVVDTKFADTVLDGVWRGGLGEIVRHAAVSDAALVKKIAKNAAALKARDRATMAETIRASIESRVKKGPTDFAEWSALRLEAMSGYKLPHGYAVPIAICIDCAYSVERGLMKESDQELVCSALAECGALDGLAHSHHILSQADGILFGLDAWRLFTGASSIVVPAGIGKSVVDENPDRDAFRKVIKEFLAVSTDA